MQRRSMIRWGLLLAVVLLVAGGAVFGGHRLAGDRCPVADAQGTNHPIGSWDPAGIGTELGFEGIIEIPRQSQADTAIRAISKQQS